MSREHCISNDELSKEPVVGPSSKPSPFARGRYVLTHYERHFTFQLFCMDWTAMLTKYFKILYHANRELAMAATFKQRGP